MRRLLLAAIDRYRARVAPTCAVCQATPHLSASQRVRDRVATEGALAGAILYTSLLMGRFERGGW